MAPDPYLGALSLAASMYASPQRNAQFTAFPFSVTSAPPANNGTIATKEQIAGSANNAATDLAAYNADAQLAIAQNEALKEEVDEHSARFAKSVSSAVGNTHQLLDLVRDSVKKESPTAASELSTVDKIWKELEEMFEAVRESKTALPKFLEKQKDNMSLYHNSVVNETMRESQTELDLQHKKERVSRLTLDKGLFKRELSDTQEQLKQTKSSQDESVKQAEVLQKEVDSLLAANQDLVAESDGLRKTMSELQDKVKAKQQHDTDQYEKELREKSEKIANEEQKTANLQVLINQLKSGKDDVQKEVEQLKAANKTVQEKFKNQTSEYGKIFNDIKEKDKQLSALSVDFENIQKQVENLKDETVNLKKENKTLSEKLKKLEKENEELKTENNDLRAKVQEYNKMSAALTILRSENAELLASVQELQSNIATAKADNIDLVAAKEKLAVEGELEVVKQELAKSRVAIKDWTDLAQRSYREYKEILPTYKLAEQHRLDNAEKDNRISKLQLELSVAMTQLGQSNGAGDATYWKDRYESLLATLG